MTTTDPGGLESHRDDDGVVWLKLNRPAVRNALDGETLMAIRDHCRQAAEDQSTRIVVLRGQHPAFSAGADLSWMKRLRVENSLHVVGDLLHAALDALHRVPVPLVVAVDGAAVGAGAAFVTCADVAIATDRAWFSVPEVGVGIVPDAVIPYLRQRVGPSWTGFWTLTGVRFTAHEAHEAGLVHRVVPAAALDDEVSTHIGRLLAGPSSVVVQTKRLLRARGLP